MDIKVIGSGCPSCDKLWKEMDEAVKELGIDATITHVTDLVEIVTMGIMTAPVIMIDGVKVVSGIYPGKAEILKLLAQAK